MVENSKDLMLTVVEMMKAGKGKDIVSLDLTDIHSSITDYFVICHAPSKTQVESIADRITETLRNEYHVKPYHTEGFENAEWILIDYVDVIVHVFLEPRREFYNIEGLWADAPSQKYVEE